MPRIAYAQPGTLPSAFAPLPAQDGRGLGPWVRGEVNGQPGTMGVPAGLPDFGKQGQVVNGTSVRWSGAGYCQGSGTMPNVWYPSLYWQPRLDGSTLVSGNQQTPSVYSDNQMPIPAADPRGRAALLARPPVFTGQKNVAQPPQSARWPSWLPTLSYGG